MKIRIWDEERQKMVYDLSEGFGYAGLLHYIIGQSEEDLSIEVIKEGENSGKLPVMESTNIYEDLGDDVRTELYFRDIMEYVVLGEKRIGIVVKRESGEWAIQCEPGLYLNLITALNINIAHKIGNVYENKELIWKE
jgi:hypothetical protein